MKVRSTKKFGESFTETEYQKCCLVELCIRNEEKYVHFSETMWRDSMIVWVLDFYKECE